MKTTPEVERAYSEALRARAHSHSPYSKFAVGAALKLTGQDQAVGGCNVENASFGGTICAERVAFHRAVAQFGSLAPEFIVIVTQETQATVPCALCLQTFAEFCRDDFTVYLASTAGVLKSYRLVDLLPYPFRQFQKDSK